ncbi:histone-lysine N-methyltransferase, H3 lysine-79 specific-like [Cydia fagiglandana]|uniref:histone-lysine N-methyltransferase, H3 lysine-79 specific-like n=1 Tax=Cydia fagiglandana TaxID=1458189 RepID=UPI002FEE0CC4
MCDLQTFYNDLKAAILNFRLDLCCFVFSVKAGILLCGYFNVISNMICLIAVSTGVFPPLMMNAQQSYMDGEYIKSTCAFAYSADLCLAVLLLCARYRKDIVLLTYYTYCGLAMLASTILVYSMVIGVLSVLHTCTLVISLTYQVYIILLVRSMMVDLKHEADRFEYFYQNYPVYYKHDIEAGDYPLETYEIYSSRKNSEIVPATLPKTTAKETVENTTETKTKEVKAITEPKKTVNTEEPKPSEVKDATEPMSSETVADVQPTTSKTVKDETSKIEAAPETIKKPKALRYPYKFIAIKVPKEEPIKEENENDQKETESVGVKEDTKEVDKREEIVKMEKTRGVSKKKDTKEVATGEEKKEKVKASKTKEVSKNKETKDVAKEDETKGSEKAAKKQKRSIFGRKKSKDDNGKTNKDSDKKN